MNEEQHNQSGIPGGETLVHGRALEVLASTTAEGDFFANAIWGRDFATAYQRDSAAFFVVDVRDWQDYCLGHIEGALHLDFNSWADPENLARLPRDRKIIVVCDNGCASAQVSAGLRLLGYDAAIIRTGMNGWTRNRQTGSIVTTLESAAFPVDRTEAAPCAPAPQGVGFGDITVEVFEKIAAAIDRQFRSAPVDGATPRYIIRPSQLHAALDNGSDEYFLLDVREDFEFEGVGHIEGACWMDFKAAAVTDNLAQLPRDRTIVTVCYTGNMAAQLATILRLLGYKALVLELGMAGWVKNPTTRTYISDIAEAENPVAELEEHDCRRTTGS